MYQPAYCATHGLEIPSFNAPPENSGKDFDLVGPFGKTFEEIRGETCEKTFPKTFPKDTHNMPETWPKHCQNMTG